MKLVVGLGNPGPRYETTRHNVGFLLVDRLVERWDAKGVSSSGVKAEVFQATVGGERTILMKPLTFMNVSGQAVAPIFKFYKCEPSDLVVIHDDLDLKPMALRLKTGGGTGGHNGLKSIDASLGAEQTNYHRVRMGIGHPTALGLPMGPADYVLQQYTDGELEQLDLVLDRAASAIEQMLRGDVTGAMNEFNRSEKGIV